MTYSDAFVSEADNPTPIQLINTAEFQAWFDKLAGDQQAWLTRQNFIARAGQLAWFETEGVATAVVGWDGKDNIATLGALPMQLPEGDYTLQTEVTDLQLIGWGLGSYQFDRYKLAKRKPARLLLSAGQSSLIGNTVIATGLTRDLINTPAGDMAPSHLSAEVQALTDQFSATCTVLVGDALLDISCGAIHAVGRAAEDPPCLIDLQWGDESAPKITLVGKGVTFDSGGLDIKPAAGMRWMKKDMGGAATAIGLAYLIMSENLPVRLRLLVPAAENAIAGNAFRPGDILNTHKGLSVEIDNTDAEGRLLLCDALSIATTEQPELIVDFATLTGSARSAVGAEVAAMFCNSDELAADIQNVATSADDAVWRMPLHEGYKYMLDSKVADLVNSAASPYGGAITAALFLQHFVEDTPWVHFDIMAFNNRARPGRPEGGEAMGLRAIFAYLEQRYVTV